MPIVPIILFLLGCAISAALYKLIMAIGYKQKNLDYGCNISVFIVVIGFFAALYTCNKASIEKPSKAATMALAKRVALFCTAILAVVCVISAYVALADPYTGANIQKMFALNFEVNAGVIWAIIVIGGTCLLALQYAVVYFFGKWFRR